MYCIQSASWAVTGWAFLTNGLHIDNAKYEQWMAFISLDIIVHSIILIIWCNASCHAMEKSLYLQNAPFSHGKKIQQSILNISIISSGVAYIFKYSFIQGLSLKTYYTFIHQNILGFGNFFVFLLCKHWNLTNCAQFF